MTHHLDVRATRLTPARIRLRRHLATAPGGRLLLALWGGLALVDATRAVQAPDAVQLGVLVVLAAALGVGQGRGAAVAVAGVVWLVATGFVVNAWGELQLTGPADAARLGLFLLAALAATEVRR